MCAAAFRIVLLALAYLGFGRGFQSHVMTYVKEGSVGAHTVFCRVVGFRWF